MSHSSVSSRLALLFTVAWLPCAAAQNSADEKPKLSLADLAKLAESFEPSLARVEYTLQVDKGEMPASENWGVRGDGDSGPLNYDQLIREERPLERAAYILSPTRVLTADPEIHPRFIKSIVVRQGAQVVAAQPAAYALDQGVMFYDLAEPLRAAKPLAFDGARPGPYYSLAYRAGDAQWNILLEPAGSWDVIITADGKQFSRAGNVLVDSTGVVVGVSGRGDLPIDGSWKGSPADWKTLTAAELARRFESIEKQSGQTLVRVALTFRSPGNADGGSPFARRNRIMAGMDDENENITEWNGLGLIVDPQTVLVLAQFKPKLTGRLEKIRVFGADGTEGTARFAGSLKEWGGFLGTLEKTWPAAAALSDQPLRSIQYHLLARAEVTVRGETRTAYINRDRINGFALGWRGLVFPDQAASTAARSPSMDRGATPGLNFLFDLEGRLVAVPLTQRPKVTVESGPRGWGNFGATEGSVLPAGDLRAVLADRTRLFDSENRPLSEAEENRLAWLGVELQPLDLELARANNAVDQTGGGQYGALVTYVYPNSPAAQAGLEMGDIVLRLRIEGQPRPLEVKVDTSPGAEMFGQLFAMMDQIPEDAFDRFPKPWGAAENPLTRALTDLGFGTPFVAEVFRNGKVVDKPFKVAESPAHFESARRYKSEPAGLTARECTYEVRRFYQLKDDDPGLVISKVEKGGKASVAGVKPLELITAVNDQPLRTVADFEKALAAGGELRLNVKRMHEGRVVTLKLDGDKPADGKSPDAKSADGKSADAKAATSPPGEPKPE